MPRQIQDNLGVLAALLASLCLSAASAQEDIEILGEGGQISPPPVETTLEFLTPPTRESNRQLPSHYSIVLRLPQLSHFETPQDRIRDMTPTHIPVGSLRYQFKGFHRFAMRRARSRYRSLYRKHLSDLWQNSSITPDGMQELATKYANAQASSLTNGNWWDRSWTDSLLPEKGGAPSRAYVHTYGKDMTILELGPLKVMNTLKAKIDKFAVLSLAPDGGRIYRDLADADELDLARDDARLRRAFLDPEEEEELDGSGDEPGQPVFGIPNIALSLEPVAKHLFEGISWRLKLRPSFRMGLPSRVDAPEEIVRKLALRCALDVYLGANRTRVGSLQCEVEYEPDDDSFEFNFEIALLTW